MRAASNTLETLIDMLYEAAFDAAKWPPFLTALAQALEGTLPTLFLLSLSLRMPGGPTLIATIWPCSRR